MAGIAALIALIVAMAIELDGPLGAFAAAATAVAVMLACRPIEGWVIQTMLAPALDITMNSAPNTAPSLAAPPEDYASRLKPLTTRENEVLALLAEDSPTPESPPGWCSPSGPWKLTYARSSPSSRSPSHHWTTAACMPSSPGTKPKAKPGANTSMTESGRVARQVR